MSPTIDVLIIVTAFAASVLRFKASLNRVKRLSRIEHVDEADINRIVVAINRTQILNARAALATALSALLVAAMYLDNILH